MCGAHLFIYGILKLSANATSSANEKSKFKPFRFDPFRLLRFAFVDLRTESGANENARDSTDKQREIASEERIERHF